MGTQTVVTTALALCLTAAVYAAPPHPRIFITPDDLPRLRAMATDTTANALGVVPAEVWEGLKAQADRFAEAGPYHYRVNMPGREGGPSQLWEYTLSDERPPRHDDYSHYPPTTAIFQERTDSITTRLKYYLLAYVVSGDTKYFEKAKEIVFHLCAWEDMWHDLSCGGRRSSLDTSHAAIWVGVFYDWCYDSLTQAERETVRTALVDKALVYLAEGAAKGAVYHNITVLQVMGLCVGSVALLGEEERTQEWIDLAVERLRLNFDAQGEDGGAMEGPMYGDYAASAIADMLRALATAGVEHDLFEHNYLRTLPTYCISLLDPNSKRQVCFGDGGPTQGFGPLMLTLASGGHTDAAWYCQQIGMFENPTVRTFMAMDPERIRPMQPTFNPSDCFVDIGYGILRDGYEPGPPYMALKCGPPTKAIGHNHYDHNSFMINYAGAWIAWDPGYRSYFDPPVRKYTVGSIGHNTIVLDLDEEYLADHSVTSLGHDQVQLAGGRIQEFFTSDAYDYLLGDAAPTYNTEDVTVLERFDRQVVFAKPNVFFIRDSLQGPEEHTFSFLMHADNSSVFRLADGSAEAVSAQALLEIHPSSPDGITLSSASYQGAESRGPYLAATTGRTKATTITTVLVPRPHTELTMNPGFEDGMVGWTPRSAEGQRPNHVIDTEVMHSGQASGRIDNNGYYYTRRFSLPPGTKITARWWAKCTAAEGASSILYHSADGESYSRTEGPAATANEWRQYELTDVVPEGVEESVLALQFFGEGHCWYDDLEMAIEPEMPIPEPTTVTALEEGATGAVVEVDGVTHLMVCGEAGRMRAVQAAGHSIETDAEIAVISLKPDGPTAFILRGTVVRLDDRTLTPQTGVWRVQRTEPATAPGG